MKRVILHIGLPKTGTTTIQNFCAEHRHRLAQAGIDYPELPVGPPGERSRVNHKAVMVALLTDPPTRLAELRSEAQRLTERAFERFRAGPCDTLFLSHETISQRRDLDYELIRRLTEGLELTVVAFVRVFDEWLESLHAQNVRSDKSIARPFSRQRLTRQRYVPQLTAMRDGLPEAEFVVLSYDQFKGGGLVEKMLEVVGADSPELLRLASATRRSNVGRSSTEVMFGLYASLAANDPAMTQTVMSAFGKAERAGARVPQDVTFRFLPPELKQEARAIYLAELKLLRDRFGLEAPTPAPLTDADLAYSSTLTPEQYRELAAIVIPFLPEDAAERVRSGYQTAQRRMERALSRT